MAIDLKGAHQARLAAAPRNAAPLTLWRIETETGRGPFIDFDTYEAMDLAAARAGIPSHTADMPNPADEGLVEDEALRSATTSPRLLARWFPRPIRQALGELGYHVVRIEAEADTVQVGGLQALYHPARSRVVERRPLMAA